MRYNDLQDMRGPPNYAEVVQDSALGGLGCGLEKSRLPNERAASPSRGNCFDRANPRP